MEIKNTVAFVTGAASGLGLATCKVLVEAGARVMAVDLDEARLASLGKQVFDRHAVLSGNVGENCLR